MKLTLDRARHIWAHAQGLQARASDDLDALVARTGWIRTLGGAEAYLALQARVEGVTLERVHAAVEEGALQILPAVRGCIYLVPREDAALALQIADLLSARRTARDMEKLEVSDAELERVGDAVLDALTDGPLDTNALRKRLPDGAIRSLGDAGKKIGVTSTLPPALRRLEFAGRIVRRPVAFRLDTERYTWALAGGDILGGGRQDAPVLHQALAERYFRWAGPATLEAFVAWSGLGKRDARAAVKAASLVEVEVEGVGACLVTAAALDAPGGDAIRLLPALDNLVALPERPTALVDAADHAVEVQSFSTRSGGTLGDAGGLFDRVIVHAGRVAGLWAWDPAANDVVGWVFRGAFPLPAEELAAAGELLRALGHGKRFGLDRDDKMAARAAELRAR